MTRIKPTLSIIIVNYNTRKLLEKCINSIIRNDKRLIFSSKEARFKSEESIPAEIIIVDNGSTDGSAQLVKSLKLKVKNYNIKLKVILNKKNLGFGKANNQGMEIAEGEYILLLNSDTEIKEGAISQTLFWLSSHPEFDLVGCKLINSDGSLQPSVGKFPTLSNVFKMLFLDRFSKNKTTMFSPKKIIEVDWVMGAFMLLRKDIFRETGGFDKNIFMYMEEVEWCYRLKKLGFKIGFYPNAKIVHLGGGSSKTGREQPIINIYKGLIYFYQKHKERRELFLLRLMLKIKALLGFSLGIILNNGYLKSTYRQALAIS